MSLRNLLVVIQLLSFMQLMLTNFLLKCIFLTHYQVHGPANRLTVIYDLSLLRLYMKIMRFFYDV